MHEMAGFPEGSQVGISYLLKGSSGVLNQDKILTVGVL